MEHPFFTVEKGWVPAAELWRGAHIFQADGSSGVVERIDFIQSAQVKDHLTVATAHTYVVGDGQWLVHNTCGRGVSEWQVGIYDDLFQNSRSFDGFQIHHAPQFNPGHQVIPNYNYNKAPAIVVDEELHRSLNNSNINGIYSDTIQDLLDKTLSDLSSIGAPETVLFELQELWEKTWPNLFP